MNVTALLPSSSLGFLVTASLALPFSASAGNIRIDFGQGFERGMDWTGAFDDELDLDDGSVFESDLAPGGQPFGFAPGDPSPEFTGTPFGDGLNIGGLTYTSFCFSKNGALGLGSSTAGCSLDPTTSPVFSPLGGEWNYLFGSAATTQSSISASLGLVDRDFATGDTFDPATASPALRIFWYGVVDAPDNTGLSGTEDDLEFQLTFFDLGGGDFDAEFSYRGPYATGIQQITTPDGTGGFNTLFFGVDADRQTGSATDPYFRFRDGAFSLSTTTQPPTTTVPEPGSLCLFATVAGALLLRRRRSVPPAA